MPSGNAHMYRQLNGRRLLTGMVLAILTLGLIVIDLGMGNPDLPAPAHVIEKMKETLGKPRTAARQFHRAHAQPGRQLAPPAAVDHGTGAGVRQAQQGQ